MSLDISRRPVGETRNRLQKVFFADAIFSTLSAIVLIVACVPLAAWMSPTLPAWIYALVGAGLVPWAWFNYQLSWSPAPPSGAVKINLAGDIAWIVASVDIIVFAPGHFTTVGLWMIGITAVIVADFAWFKYRAWR